MNNFSLIITGLVVSMMVANFYSNFGLGGIAEKLVTILVVASMIVSSGSLLLFTFIDATAVNSLVLALLVATASISLLVQKKSGGGLATLGATTIVMIAAAICFAKGI